MFSILVSGTECLTILVSGTQCLRFLVSGTQCLAFLLSAGQCSAFLVSAAQCLAFLIAAVQFFCNLFIVFYRTWGSMFTSNIAQKADSTTFNKLLFKNINSNRI